MPHLILSEFQSELEKNAGEIIEFPLDRINNEKIIPIAPELYNFPTKIERLAKTLGYKTGIGTDKAKQGARVLGRHILDHRHIYGPLVLGAGGLMIALALSDLQEMNNEAENA